MKDFFYFKFVCIFSLALGSLTACNKDEELVIDNPDDDGSSVVSFQVVEYLPAPGQFINERASGFDNVLTSEEAIKYAQGRLDSHNFVSLGAFGGFLKVKASKPIPNTGGYDFFIAGNAFDTSNEPGIVYVMRDENGNGIADETWYELKGSHYDKEGFQKDYSVTYYRPAEGENDVRWTDSNGSSGLIRWQGNFHTQDYYPLWIKADSYTLSGSKLPEQIERDPDTGQWSSLPFQWGYADNNGEDSSIVSLGGRTLQVNYFRISDAVDQDGNAMNLDDVDFIKVQSAVNGHIGILGEMSTEICGFFCE